MPSCRKRLTKQAVLHILNVGMNYRYELQVCFCEPEFINAKNIFKDWDRKEYKSQDIREKLSSAVSSFYSKFWKCVRELIAGNISIAIRLQPLL